jgi:serine/threonine protein phosphatase PrpC
MFQKLLQKHLARGILGRKMLFIDKGSIALASDLGLKRTENQDRAAVMKFSSSTAFYTVIAVVDGMGGMRDGEKSAELAISTFFSSVLETVHLGSEHAITQATQTANNAVFEFTNGKGGSTLSAILLCSDDMNMTVNVGDSRIYARDPVFNNVIRLTVDDSLADVVGGSGTELLQFIGMGEGIRPHVAPLIPEAKQVYLTTDGVHYIEPQTLSDIIKHTEKITQVVERLIATARWCGGPDNATICAIDLELLSFEEHIDDTAVVQISDPLSSMQFICGNSLVEQQITPEKLTSNEAQHTASPAQPKEPDTDEIDTSTSGYEQVQEPIEEGSKTEAKKAPQRKKPQPKKKVDKSDVEDEIKIELTIFDDVSGENHEVKDDSSK